MIEEPKMYRVGTLTYTRRTLAILCIWLLWGDVCYILMETVVPTIMPLKFKDLGAPNTVVGLILVTIPGIINTVLNPIISFRSDRYRSRWGRRIPFIVMTLPFLVVCLIGLGFGDQIGLWLHGHFESVLGRFSPNTVALVVIGTMMILFSFFNTFVNAVFWYLFNDVVPEHLLARFMSWFRMVSTGAGALYSLFVFKYAGTHSSEIMAGAALLYLVGFTMMCLNVKEGEYPPPAEYVGGQVGVIAAAKTFGKECLGLSHYWYVFLVGICMAATYVTVPFTLFYFQAIGLDLDMIGKIYAAGGIASAVAILASGWLADRYHPIRVVMAGLLMSVFVSGPAGLIWLFWQPSPRVTFYVMLAVSIALSAPAGALVGILDPPLFMRIFPRDRYGQFCSANAMIRSGAAIISGVLCGMYLDTLKGYWGPRTAYCCLPIWLIFFYALMLFFMYKLYRSWKRYGGDESYVPPLPQTTSSSPTDITVPVPAAEAESEA